MSDFIATAVEMIRTATDAANAVAQRVAASTVNVNKQVHDILKGEDTTDPVILKWRAYDEEIAAKREQARAKAEAYAKENMLNVESLSDEEREAAKSEYDMYRTQRNSVLKALEAMPGFNADEHNIADLLTFSGRKGSSGGAGTGGKRPRLASATVNGEEVANEDGKVTFTLIAQHITKDSGTKIGPRDLQEAAFDAAGTDDLSTVTSVEFVISAGDNNYDVTVIPAAPKGEDD